MDKQLALWLTETVGYEQATGTDAFGQPTYAAKVDVACFVEAQYDMQRAASSDTLIGQGTVLLFDGTAQAQAFSSQDRFTLPTSGLALKPKAVIPYFDERGAVWAVEVRLE